MGRYFLFLIFAIISGIGFTLTLCSLKTIWLLVFTRNLKIATPKSIIGAGFTIGFAITFLFIGVECIIGLI